MKKYLLWFRKVLLALSALIALWFVGQAAKGAWDFFRLNAQISAKILKWEVKELSSSHYALQATFRYSVEGKEFIGQTLLSRLYLNQYAAESDIKSQADEWKAWYQQRCPSFSSLEKKFPKKEFINSFLTLGVFIYFYFIRGLLFRFESEKAQ